MFKRPLIPAVVCSILFSAFIVLIFPQWIYPASNVSPGEIIVLQGKVTRIEEKDWAEYIYLKADGKTLLITVSEDLFRLYGLLPGNHIRLEAEYTGFNKARNEGNFDEEDHYRSLGVYQKYKLKKIIENDRHTDTIGAFLIWFRDAMKAKVFAALEGNDEEKGIILALLSGDKKEVDDEMLSLYQCAGIAHILAISGLHISFLGMMVYRIIRKLFGHHISAIAAVGMAIFFSVMSGGSPSSVRAVIMLTVRLGAVSLGKRYDMISSLSLACILMLITNPFYLTNSGFLLSFAAIGALGVLSEPLNRLFIMIFKPKKKLFQRICSLGISCLAVSLSVLPVILTMYYEFPLYGFLVNIVVLPLMTFVLAGAFAGAAISFILPQISGLILGGSIMILKLFSLICSTISSLPGAIVITGKPSVWQIIIYYLILGLCMAVIIFLIRFRGRDSGCRFLVKRSYFTIYAILALSLLIFIITFRMSEPGVRICFVDVGQGECIVLTDENGNVYMIDAGTTGESSVYKNRIKSTLKYSGISKVDVLIVTHPDTDHISGIFEMLEDADQPGHIKLGEIMLPKMPGNENYDRLTDLAAEKRIPVRDIYSGLELDSEDFKLICLHPSEGFVSDDANDMSAVVLFKYGNFRALFTGDISSAVEQTLEVPNCMLLDVSHHGSKYSSDEEFLAEVSPQIAVISAGKNNLYGHPAPETLARLKEVEADIFCTADNGEVIINVFPDGTVSVLPTFSE